MTYSVIGRDERTGAMGVAVQSHFLAVGRYVPWGRPGVGVVATQANVDVGYGSRGLALLEEGATAAEALRDCVAADTGSAMRQVAVLDASGGTAAHTGEQCRQSAADCAAPGVSAQANMVSSPEIPEAMVSAFRGDQGDLAARLLAALDAAQAHGGDLRGQQSASLLVVSGDRGAAADGVILDLRVDDHADPLGELRRLVGLHRAFVPMWEAMRGPACRGSGTASPDELEAAIAAFRSAQEVYGPANPEPSFWLAVALWRAGRFGESAVVRARVSAAGPGWDRLFAEITVGA